MHQRTSTLSRALIPLLALAGALLIAPGAQAVTPEEFTERCIDKMRLTTQKTTQAISTATDRGVNKVETLDANDRPVPLIRRAAAKSNVKIEKIETKGDRQINKTANRCIRLLARGEPNPVLISAINDARALAIGAIHESSIAAHQSIRETLETALEDEDDVDDGGDDGPIE